MPIFPKLIIPRLALLFLAFVSIASPCSAQTAEQELSKAELMGYYRFDNNRDMYLKISSRNGKLLLTQGWDFKEIEFEQRSELSFFSAKDNFPLVFSRDSTGAVASVLAFGKDRWVKAPDFNPEQEPLLSREEEQALHAKTLAMAKALGEAINSNQYEKLAAFVNSSFAPDLIARMGPDRIRNLRSIYRSTGGIRFARELSFSAKSHIGDYQFAGALLGNLLEMSIRLDTRGKIGMFSYRIDPGPMPAANGMGEKALIAKLQGTLAELEKRDLFSGTVLIAKADKVLFEHAAGESNKALHIKNNINTRFNLGSMNKMFTSVSIMQLAEQGKLNLNDTISRYIDSTWLAWDIASKISIRQLLSHTSGLGDFFGAAYNSTPKEKLRKLEGYKPFIKANKLAFEPGHGWAYSNAGMILLGAIVENVSGMNYFDYVNRYIYTPAGMNASGVFDIALHPVNVAEGYIPQADGTYINNNSTSGIRGSSAGGGYSNVHDLHKFALALMSGKLVSEASKEKMFTDQAGKSYGLGFQIWNGAGGKAVGHSGGAPGVNAIEYILPEKGYVIVLMSNYDGAVPSLGEYILRQVKTTLD